LPPDRFRHGRHLDRRLALRWRIRARIRDRGRGRAHARADDADPYRGGGGGPMRWPMMLLHTVAAGGGSVLHFDGARFRVGPDSAGANPGPTCYRRGGPLAVTEANVMVGRLPPDSFPKIFGAAQNPPLDAQAVRNAFADLAQQVGGRTAEEVADGFI